MGGYGQYVWGSVAVTLVALCTEWLLLRQRRKAALSQVKRKLILREEGSR
nr:heme exporter protein CcmD [Limnobacter sp. UBA3528]